MADRDFTALRRPCCSCASQVRAAEVQTTLYSTRNTSPGSNQIPWLNLRGRWLDNAGFHVNTPMTIHVMPGCIVLVAGDGGDNNTGNDGQSKAARKAAKKDSS